MKICMLINNITYNINHSERFKNNRNDYSQYRGPVLTGNDTFSFTGGSLKNLTGKKAITSLASLDVPCFCCGRKLIDKAEIDKLEAAGIFKEKSGVILKHLDKYQSFMHPIEKKIFNLLKQLNKKYPQKTLSQLLQSQTGTIEASLIKKQSKVFGQVYEYCKKHLDADKLEKFTEIINESYREIYKQVPDTTFSRKKFIGLTYKNIQDLSRRHQKNLIKIAEKLPSSEDETDAFIMKYSRKKSREIAIRLISKSIGTVEHIKPKAEGGADSIYNYALECGFDNWARGNAPMFTLIKDHPDMPQNAQKQADRIIELVNRKKCSLDYNYVLRYAEALKRATGGIIDIDTSKLHVPN